MQARKLGYFDITMIVISLVIGMGIFRTPAMVAATALTPGIYYAAWIIGGIIALCGALTFAEIGSRLPVSGGYYRIFSHCFHPSFAFMLNCTILVSNAASVAGVALIGAEYLSGMLLPAGYTGMEEARVWIAAGEIFIFYGLNMLGLKTSARTQNVLTLFKIGIVLLLCVAVFSPSKEYVFHPYNYTEPVFTWKQMLISLGICLIPISFTYGGYQQTINFGSEVRNAPKVMPRGIILGIGIVVILYMMINYAYMDVIQFENLGHSENIASTLARKVLGSTGQKIFTLVFFFAVLAYVNVGLMSNPRVIQAMSEEKVLPGFFARLSKRYGVPVIALSVFTALCLGVLLFASTFDRIVNYVIFLDALGLVAAASTVFILRKRKTGEDLQPYKMKLFPVAPVFFMLAYAFVTFSIISNNPKSVVYGLLVFISFLPVYFILRYLARRKNTL
jgi:basic amino acid/polyamine antiporter, APA family